MIGKHVLELISPATLIKGVASGAEITDGGFSNETDQVQLTAVPGVLYAPTASVDSDTDTRLTGNIIASCPDMVFSSPNNRLCVTDDGKAYRYNGTKLNATGVALTAAQTWVSGFTDILTFQGEAYVSSEGQLTRWQSNDTIDAGGSWPFSFGTSNVPHPGIVYENNMYWGDKNLLLIQSAVGDSTAPTTILTLDAGQMIVALGIDPSSGLMLISTKNVLDVSGTIATANRLLWYDGNSLKVSKSVVIDDAILSFENVGSFVIVGYGNNIGYLSGAGIQWLRRLVNVQADNTQLPYKHHVTHIDNAYYVLDGKQIMAFGEIQAGKKVWYPAWSNPFSANKPTFIADVGSKKLGIGFATTKFYTFDTSAISSTGSLTFVTNKFTFDRPILVRGFYFEYIDAIPDGDENRFVYYRTEDVGSGFVLLHAANNTDSIIKNTSGGAVYFFDIPINGIGNDKVRSFQLRYSGSGNQKGLKRVLLAYDVGE